MTREDIEFAFKIGNFVLPAIIGFTAFLVGLKFANKEMASDIKGLKEAIVEFKQSVKADIDRLEKKQDKYNNLQERTAIVEQSAKSAHHRMDEIKEEVGGLRKWLQEILEAKG